MVSIQHSYLKMVVIGLRASFSFLTDRLSYFFNPLVKASCVSRITNYQLKGF